MPPTNERLPYEKPRIDVISLGELLEEAERIQTAIEETLGSIAQSVEALVSHLQTADLDTEKLRELVGQLTKVQAKAGVVADLMAQAEPNPDPSMPSER